MADVNVPAGRVGAYELALAAGTARSVGFADDLDFVEVSSLAADKPVYFTVDGSAPTVTGANCYMLLPGVNAAQIVVPTAGGTQVRLITAGTATVSVART